MWCLCLLRRGRGREIRRVYGTDDTKFTCRWAKIPNVVLFFFPAIYQHVIEMIKVLDAICGYHPPMVIRTAGILSACTITAISLMQYAGTYVASTE